MISSGANCLTQNRWPLSRNLALLRRYGIPHEIQASRRISDVVPREHPLPSRRGCPPHSN